MKDPDEKRCDSCVHWRKMSRMCGDRKGGRRWRGICGVDRRKKVWTWEGHWCDRYSMKDRIQSKLTQR